MTRNIVLFVNAIRPATFEAFELHAKQTGRKFTPLVLVDKTIKLSISKRNAQQQVEKKCTVISANFDSPKSVKTALAPYFDKIFAVTSQYENSILELKKLVPFFPNLNMPSQLSLEASTEKKLMRSMLVQYDNSLVPKFVEVLSLSRLNVVELEQKLSYPMMVKPSGLEGSLLVSRVNNTLELKRTLEETFSQIQTGYDTWIKRQTPAIVVEEYMEGDMYSIDTYISSKEKYLHTPPVKVVTGENIGLDDFFGYMRLAPSGLSDNEVRVAEITSEKACKALGLKSVTAHVELMKTKSGWKVIELGPRIGGYRHDIYQTGFGINHIMNDILNRADELTEVICYKNDQAAVFNIYARNEGILSEVNGIDAVASTSSYKWHKQSLKKGSKLFFAKHNGDPVVELMMGNHKKQKFDQDVRFMENTLDILTTTK